MHICFDWDGTLAKPDVAREASSRRGKWLSVGSDHEYLKVAQKTNVHYNLYREALEKYTGVSDKKLLTEMMTNIFQIHYLSVVHELQEKIFYDGILTLLAMLKKENHTLSIASTLRLDIIEPVLISLDKKQFFSKIYANTPDLSFEKDYLVKLANEYGTLHFMVGDKEEDLLAGKRVHAKTVFVSWGAGDLTHPELADYVVNTPQELANVLLKQ